MKIISRKIVWQGFVTLSQMVVRLGNGRKMLREVHDHGNAACVLPADYQHSRLLLVRQARMGVMCNPDPAIAADGFLLEVVAGLVEKGESPAECACREALEETGYAIHSPMKIAEGFSSPGTLTEYFFLFAAQYDSTARKGSGGGVKHEGEEIEVVELSFDEAKAMLERGEIRDAKTIIALNWLFCRHLT